MEFRDLGRYSWVHAGRRAHAGQNECLPIVTREVRIAITFLIVSISWVFFRADTLGFAGRYLQSLFGLPAHTTATDLVAGVIYTPYHLSIFLICAVVVWTMPQAWTFTQRLTLTKQRSVLLHLRSALCFSGLKPLIHFSTTNFDAWPTIYTLSKPKASTNWLRR